ncbi:MAG: sulfotransferase family protein [archaeon]
MSKTSFETPIFIGGVGRSGTTLIQAMLNAHGNISFTPETHFIKNYLTNYKVLKKAKKGNESWIEKKIINDDYLKRLNFNSYLLVEILRNNNFNLLKFYKELLIRYSKKNDKDLKYIGEKDPKFIEHFKEINDIFPKAKIIHIIRDPRDVVLSRMKTEWSKDRNYLIHSLIYRLQLNKALKDGKKYFGNNYYQVFYEDLLNKPEKILKDLSKFLNIKYEKDMLNFNKKADEIVRKDEEKWKKNCYKPVLKNNYNKWKKELSNTKIYFIELICLPAFNKFNLYTKNNKKIDLKDVLLNHSINLIIDFFELIYNFYHKYRSNKVCNYFRSLEYVEK